MIKSINKDLEITKDPASAIVSPQINKFMATQKLKDLKDNCHHKEKL